MEFFPRSHDFAFGNEINNNNSRGFHGEVPGHAEAALERSAGRSPYIPTAPLLGGLQAPEQQPETKISVMVGNRRPVKMLPIYLRYTAAGQLNPLPGFVISSWNAYAEADIIVVEKLSDVDSTRNEHLAALLACNFILLIYNHLFLHGATG